MGKPIEDIAVVGFSFKLPQDVNDDSSLWKVLEDRRNLMTGWPESRINAESFVNDKHHKFLGVGGHFINEDVSTFDAPFFSLTAKEAASMDPMQRWTLEASYRAFEKAGIPVESLKGSRTAVFSASMMEDYARMAAMDPDNTERTAVTGCTVACVIPNRVSWYFDLRGPSIHVNTACSSSLSAVDMACKTLGSGDASCALVTGSNLLLDPVMFQLLSSQNFLSPHSVCYSFDHRANGYARGEGIIALVLKPLSAAVRDGDMIRAVIRSTGSNQDGHTPGLTQPSPQAQEDLIRHVYKQADLSLDYTRYVEAHGTGTPVGDPIEMKAIGSVFRECRSNEEPLYVGSIKANVGHLEGASGLAGILKAILILEKGIIPPNALFERINPAINASFYHVDIPTESIAWPSSGLRRVSVNSFGFGGSNTHVVLDDALHYLRSRGITGNHGTVAAPGTTLRYVANGTTHDPVARLPKLLVWSASDEKAIKRTMQGYESFCADKVWSDPAKLNKLAFTLAARRSHMLWRTFAVITDGLGSQAGQAVPSVKPIRSSAELELAFVFTGQGAQYVDMGWDLIKYPVFDDTLRRIDDIYRDLGCEWSIFDELRCGENIDKPEYSQPLSTAVQIALVELLKSFGVVPKAVVGHSSGEIAAAYSIGALSLLSACKVSYFRGQLAGKLKVANASSPGSMISINLTEDQVAGYLENIKVADSVGIACVNSPLNCTLSGAEAAIDAVKVKADKDGIFAQKLKTGVAYHSSSMLAIADEYQSLMGNLEGAAVNHTKAKSSIPMVSTVSGKPIRPAELARGQYWVDNMVSPVRFSDALQVLTQDSSFLKAGLNGITDLIEVGPHPALRRPVQDTINKTGANKKIRYASALHRSHPATESMLELAGQLFSLGHAISVAAVNQQSTDSLSSFLVDCPEYPFDHSQRHWSESRISQDFRLRKAVKGETLGVRVSDWNPLEPRWRNFLCVESMPWIGDHVVDGKVVFPAAGMLVMAIEAVLQAASAGRSVAGVLVQEAHFLNTISVQEAWEDRTETQVQLRPSSKSHNGEPTKFETVIFSYSRGDWTECFRASLQIEYQESGAGIAEEKRLADEDIRSKYNSATEICRRPVDSHVFYRDAAEQGLKYGDWFQLVEDVHSDDKTAAIARVDVSKARYQTTSLVHPAVLETAFQVLRLSGGQQPAANAPVSLSNAWFSFEGWQHPQTSSVRWLATSASSTVQRGEKGSLYALADDGTVLCTIREAVTAPSSKATEEKERKLLHSIEWKPQLSLLERQQLKDVCRADTFTRDESTILVNHAKMCSALDVVCARVLKQIDRSKIPEALYRHVAWMEHHVSKLTPEHRLEGETMSDADIEARLQEVEVVLPAWKLYTECARKLPEMLAGEIDPLAVVFGSNLADIFYADLFQSLCADGRLSSFLDLTAHENPTLRILEIGAGTGGVTGHVLSILQEREKQTGAPSFAEYTYTDISPMFFEQATSRWSKLRDQGRMVFKTLDQDRTIESQGFTAGSYDMIIAGSVLHATPYLEVTIRNVRKLLKPGGRLMLLEVINPADIAINFMAGLLPGWWVAKEEWRPHSACVSEEVWDRVLAGNGFSGNDLVIRDYKHEECHITSIIISTAQEEPKQIQESKPKAGRLVLVIDGPESGRQEQQQKLADLVRSRVDSKGDRQAVVCTFSPDQLLESLADLAKDDIVICLAEVNNRSLLTSLSESGFRNLQRLVREVPKLLWATATSTSDAHYPDYSFVQGFLRSIRAEQADSQIVSLAIEGEMDDESCASFIAKAFQSAFESSLSKELEYVVRDGVIVTGRAIENVTGNGTLQSLLHPQLQSKTWGEGLALQLSVDNDGALDSLRFIQDNTYETEIKPHEVEVEAKAWGLKYQDIEPYTSHLEVDYAGIVNRVGPDCNPSIQKGDRVCMASLGGIRKYSRAQDKSIIKIPDTMSFEAAVSTLLPSIMSYYALIDIGRLQEGEKVLIHSAAGSVGQLAVQIAKAQGADIFVTVSSNQEKQLLINSFDIPENRIFTNQNTSYAKAVMRVTQGYGVDVVFNTLLGEDKLQASGECLASYGRFLEVGRGNIDANVPLPMAIFARNATFSAIDLTRADSKVMIGLLEKAVQLLGDGKIQSPEPVQNFSVSDIEQAFKQLQSSRDFGRVIISPNPQDVVPQFVQEQRSWTFDGNASYIIAGGSGGLGRAIMKWMADRGAKHLIVPSRSGASSKAASETVAELAARGVNVVAPKCDVSSESSLASVLDECARTMPPIKGCINAAMVLQDAIFQNMTFAQWDLTIRSKVQTAWNLHRLLPKDLDFFILLASLAGVTGQMASSNYAGGCSFQDAMARYRVAQGQKAVSLDMGWMRNIGIIAETSAYQRQRQDANNMQPIDDTELFALLTLCCDPANPPPAPTEAHGQMLFGLRTPADILAQGQTPPALLDRPLLAAFSYIPGSGAVSSQEQAVHADQGASTRFRQAPDSAERKSIVMAALAAKLARAMFIPPGDVEPSKPLSSYGVDSLMAVDIRNWIHREFDATVSTVDIQGGKPITRIADLVVEKSSVGKTSA
ncbi:hypothetical protein F5Y04DRAFT_168710 [Hypomontagnella monticulosa]|nr:hypothetical protein F5Y04DRAFT_168710 [Hypomontagnella monticulosa]